MPIVMIVMLVQTTSVSVVPVSKRTYVPRVQAHVQAHVLLEETTTMVQEESLVMSLVAITVASTLRVATAL